jgi:DNA polymerase
MDQELKKDLARYFARQGELGNHVWLEPAGVPAAESGGESDAAATGSDTEQAAVTAPRLRSPQKSSSSPIAAIREGMRRAEEEWIMPSITDEGKRGDSPWPKGAPEPEPVVPVAGQVEDPFPDYKDLNSFREAISGCLKCPLGATRNSFVYGVGDPNADLVLVGEAPGAEEDKLGEPFVGRAGKLLDQILEAVDLNRGDGVYIANILKCRPPGNRDPQPSEVQQCEPHLVKQLHLIQPKLILALGRIAAQTLLRTSESLSRLRGHIHDYHGIPLMVTFHPAALLRNPNWKRPTWEDVQAMRKLLNEKRDVS